MKDELYALRHDTDPTTRYNAAVQLGLRGDELVASALIDALRDPDWGVRQNAAWAAGQAGLRTCIPALAVRLTDDHEDEQVRYVVALALVRLGAVVIVQRCCDHPLDAVQRVAVAALRTHTAR